jgi:D-alanyl-D-alanine carboxypeptidase
LKHLDENKLPKCEQVPLQNLEVIEIDHVGRPILLEKAAAQAWRHMCLNAESDNITFKPFSGFRSYLYQKQVIKQKLDLGLQLNGILKEIAIPGFSEHHGGCAVDICVLGDFSLSEEFEKTEAFVWLKKKAANYNFSLSYPRDNPNGIVYEPWHWCYKAQ